MSTLVSRQVLLAALSLAPLHCVALNCAEVLKEDRQRSDGSTLGYRERAGRCEGMFEEDHGNSPKLIVRRYTVGDFLPVKSAEANLFIRGLPAGTVGQITVVSNAKKYRLDAEVSGAGVFRWPLDELYTRVGADAATLFVLGRTNSKAGVTFFPVGLRQQSSAAGDGKVALTIEMPMQSPAVTAQAGKTLSMGGQTRTCRVDPNAGAAGSWYSVGQGDALTVAALPQPDGAFCIRFEIQLPGQASASPLFDRQELYFGK